MTMYGREAHQSNYYYGLEQPCFFWAHAGVPRYLTNSYQCHDIVSNVHQEGIYIYTHIYGADTTVVKCLALESSTRNSNGKGNKGGVISIKLNEQAPSAVIAGVTY